MKRGGNLKRTPLRRKQGLKPWSKKAKAEYTQGLKWMKDVYFEYLETFVKGEVKHLPPCMATGKLMLWRELTMDHVLPRQKFPEEKNSPFNWALVSGEFNKKKGSKVVEDYRSEPVRAWISLCVMRDWTKVGRKWYLNRKGEL